MKELDAYHKQDLICNPVKWVSSRTGTASITKSMEGRCLAVIRVGVILGTKVQILHKSQYVICFHLSRP